MVTSWKLNDLQRQAQAKRADLDNLNAFITRLDRMLSDAQDFEGHFNERLAEAQRGIFEVAPRIQTYNGFTVGLPYTAHPSHPAECERRQADLHAIERERDEERARRTTSGTDGFRTVSFCELRPSDIINKRQHVVIARDQVARELASIEEQMTPGQLVTSGVPAAEYEEHRQRVVGLRERLGVTA